jgi:ribosomal protein S16
MSALDGTSLSARGERELASRASRSQVRALRARVEKRLPTAELGTPTPERVSSAPAAPTPDIAGPTRTAGAGRTATGVKIRLKRLGRIRVPQYRIVVVDSRKKRDGKVIEEIGKYHPKEEPSSIDIVSERAQYWLGVGAQPSEAVEAILKVTGDWQKFKGLPGAVRAVEKKSARTKLDIFDEALKKAEAEAEPERNDSSS